MSYKNFKLAFYSTVNCIRKSTLEEVGKKIDYYKKYLHLDKVYIELFRSNTFFEEENLQKYIDLFKSYNIKTSAGITTNLSHSNIGFNDQFCYTNPDHINTILEAVKQAARHFDELIFDDFYFTTCKCARCVSFKGSKTWQESRLSLIEEMSRKIMITGKQINPSMNIIIKFPNWYDTFPFTGYNPEAESKIFDSVYTGTETRDAQYSRQNLQKYLSYFISRYLENVKPGKNMGCWFDKFNCEANPNFYVDQAELSLFSRTKEITLFAFSSMYDTIYIPMLDHVLNKLDNILGELGEPVGIPCYKPSASNGENHLYDYLGMIGLPLEPYPRFPDNKNFILLTESSLADPEIFIKIKNWLLTDTKKTLILTSGFLKSARQSDAGEFLQFFHLNQSVMIDSFGYNKFECFFRDFIKSPKEITIPKIAFGENDCYDLIKGINGYNSYPLLLETNYAGSSIYLLTIPDNFSDLYEFPGPVLSSIRKYLSCDLPVYLEGEKNIALFIYNNNSIVVKSFLPYPSNVQLVIKNPGATLLNCITSREMQGVKVDDVVKFNIFLMPSKYLVFKFTENNQA